MDRRRFVRTSLGGAGGLRSFGRSIYGYLTTMIGRGSELRNTATGQPPTPSSGEQLHGIALEFGVQDMVPARWNGSVSISQGIIAGISGHNFGKDDKVLDDHTWQAATREWLPTVATGDINPKEEAWPHGTRLKTVGVTIYCRAPESATLHVKIQGAQYGYPVTKIAGSSEAPFLDTPTKQFDFRISDLPESAPLYLLDSRVQARRVPRMEQVSSGEYETDYPSVAMEESGDIWVAWIGYRNLAEEVFARHFSVSKGSWSEIVKVSEKPGDFFCSAIAVDRKGRPWIVWSERQGSDWHLMARYYEGGIWSETRQLTHGKGNNLFPRLKADRNCNLHLVWQGFRGRGSDILLKSLTGESWSPEMNLSDPGKGSRVNDWMPTVTADHSGTVWVAWDNYATGSYNILLRPVRNGKPGELLRVTDSARYHAHADIEVDDQGRLWIAYDEAEENWGKDHGYHFAKGAGLYRSRKIRFAVLDGKTWLEPRSDLHEVVPVGARRFVQLPRLVSDGKGHLWALFRSRTSAEVEMSQFAWGGQWELMASYYSGDRWSAPVTIPESETAHNQESPFGATVDREGRLWLICAAQGVLVGSLSAGSSAAIELGPRAAEPPARQPVEPDERKQVTAIRKYSIQIDGKTYKIYRGDMHRHTEISGDGAGEGSLWDAYRYALDAAGLDFIAITDHSAGGTEYTWWRTEKAADIFHLPGFFVPLFGYERSVNYPNGHRNIIFARRGVRPLPPAPHENVGWKHGDWARAMLHIEVEGLAGRKVSGVDEEIVRSEEILYPYLRLNGGIAMPHTPCNMVMGTDWGGDQRFHHDPRLEPLIEIFQGARTSSEYEGAPLAPSRKNPELQHGEAGGYQPLGWVWKAWAKGYKLGVQCSSDHTSTHCSYACILAESGTREGLLNAMRRRHSYGATSNIIMDFRLREQSTEYLMGDEATLSTIPLLLVKIIGTAPLWKVHVIRDTQYIYLKEGESLAAEFSYRENSLTRGDHYYYVRVEQKDGNVAWSSPIWVKYKP